MKKIWHSICSAHQEKTEGCPLCDRGWYSTSWHDIVVDLKLQLLYFKRATIRFFQRLYHIHIRLGWQKFKYKPDKLTNEFHHSLGMDIEALILMNDEEQQAYYKDLIKRRNIAHQRDFK